MKDGVEAAQQKAGGGSPQERLRKHVGGTWGAGGRTCVGYFYCVPLRCLIESMSPLRAVCERVARLSFRHPSPSSPTSDSCRQLMEIMAVGHQTEHKLCSKLQTSMSTLQCSALEMGSVVLIARCRFALSRRSSSSTNTYFFL